MLKFIKQLLAEFPQSVREIIVILALLDIVILLSAPYGFWGRGEWQLGLCRRLFVVAFFSLWVSLVWGLYLLPVLRQASRKIICIYLCLPLPVLLPPLFVEDYFFKVSATALTAPVWGPLQIWVYFR